MQPNGENICWNPQFEISKVYNIRLQRNKDQKTRVCGECSALLVIRKMFFYAFIFPFTFTFKLYPPPSFLKYSFILSNVCKYVIDVRLYIFSLLLCIMIFMEHVITVIRKQLIIHQYTCTPSQEYRNKKIRRAMEKCK